MYCTIALYPVECLQTNTRAKGMSFYAFTVSAIGFINTYCGPIGLQNLKYNYVWVFVGWDVVEATIWYFCKWPDCQCYSFEGTAADWFTLRQAPSRLKVAPWKSSTRFSTLLAQSLLPRRQRSSLCRTAAMSWSRSRSWLSGFLELLV